MILNGVFNKWQLPHYGGWYYLHLATFHTVVGGVCICKLATFHTVVGGVCICKLATFHTVVGGVPLLETNFQE